MCSGGPPDEALPGSSSDPSTVPPNLSTAAAARRGAVLLRAAPACCLHTGLGASRGWCRAPFHHGPAGVGVGDAWCRGRRRGREEQWRGAPPVAGAGHEEEGRCDDYERRRGGSEGGRVKELGFPTEESRE